MGLTEDTLIWGQGKVEAGKDVKDEIVSGLTDTTGDIIDDASEFTSDAAEDFQNYITDPVMKEVENAQEWSHKVQGDLNDDLEWAKIKAAEGYIEQTEFLFGTEGWFKDVTEPVEQAWAATENNNYLDASLYTGAAFLNAVDVVGTGGLGKMAYDWIMGSDNKDDDIGPLYWEAIDENHIMVAYEGEEQFFRFDRPEDLGKFIEKLESEGIGAGEGAWGSETEAEDFKDYTDYDTQGTYGDPTPDTAGLDAKIANDYKNDPGLVKGGKGR